MVAKMFERVTGALERKEHSFGETQVGFGC